MATKTPTDIAIRDKMRVIINFALFSLNVFEIENLRPLIKE